MTDDKYDKAIKEISKAIDKIENKMEITAIQTQSQEESSLNLYQEKTTQSNDALYRAAAEKVVKGSKREAESDDTLLKHSHNDKQALQTAADQQIETVVKHNQKNEENDDEYDPNDDEDEAILAAPLAKLKDIK